MPVELPPNTGVVEDRLASLEDPLLAERLFRDHPELYPENPPETERQVLAWATRRFGTAVLAVTGLISIAAGYFFSPFVARHETPPAPTPAIVVPAASHPAPAHRHATTPLPPLHPAQPHHVARAPIVHKPSTSREEAALRAKLRAQDAELAALRRRIAANEAAAREAHRHAAAIAAAAHAAAVRAAHHASATRALPASHPYSHPATRPQPQPQPQRQASAATIPATSTRTSTASAPDPASDPAGATASAPAPDSGTKPAPSDPGGVWTERPPHGGVYGAPGPIHIGGPIDPCTPQGGRIGIVINTVNAILGSHGGGLRFR
jgi:hypothetical protein